MKRTELPEGTVAYWWLNDPVRFSCGHAVDVGYPLRHQFTDPPNDYDLMHAYTLGRMAKMLVQWPCPWCGGEGDVVQALSPQSTMAYDPDTDILMRKASDKASKSTAKSTAKGARKHASGPSTTHTINASGDTGPGDS